MCGGYHLMIQEIKWNQNYNYVGAAIFFKERDLYS